MKGHVLVEEGKRRWIVFGRDPERLATIIDTNQYLVMDGKKGMLLDPGGMEVFPHFSPVLSREIDLDAIEVIITSHQDPDIVSALALWIDICPNAKVYVPTPWALFIPHLCGGKPLQSIPDAGMTVPLGDSMDLRLIPAHYLHSSGNFSLYDPITKVLFSGDIGAAILPDASEAPFFCENFEKHIEFMKAFHQRWMPSERAKKHWIAKVHELDIAYMCPQHGSIFRGDDVKRFLDWFEALEVGIAAEM